MKFEIDGNRVFAYIDEDRYFCTNEAGDGVFYVNYKRNIDKQIEGTCQFTVSGVKDKKGKLRRYVKAYMSTREM